VTAAQQDRAVRVVLVDDQELVRSGLRRILRPRDGFEIVAELDDGDAVETEPAVPDADLVVMDLRMKRVDGITATARLRERDEAPPVLVLTTFDDDELLSGALRAGAAGFVLKDSSADELVRAAHTVAAGRSWLDPAVTARVLATYRDADSDADSDADGHRVAAETVVEELTDRELEVLRAMASGWSNHEIAERLVISELTVKSHIGRIFTKLGLRDRAAAIIYAFDHGVVRPQR